MEPQTRTVWEPLDYKINVCLALWMANSFYDLRLICDCIPRASVPLSISYHSPSSGGTISDFNIHFIKWYRPMVIVKACHAVKLDKMWWTLAFVIGYGHQNFQRNYSKETRLSLNVTGPQLVKKSDNFMEQKIHHPFLKHRILSLSPSTSVYDFFQSITHL